MTRNSIWAKTISTRICSLCWNTDGSGAVREAFGSCANVRNQLIRVPVCNEVEVSNCDHRWLRLDCRLADSRQRVHTAFKVFIEFELPLQWYSCVEIEWYSILINIVSVPIRPVAIFGLWLYIDFHIHVFKWDFVNFLLLILFLYIT